MSNIVIVDDRSINRTIYAKLAQSIGPGIEVRDFGDPTDALEWLALNRADLIITDHDMPQIDGDEFITRFRAMPRAETVPVMMITVNDQRMLRLRALESGANDFLHSPVDHCEFVMRARNLLKLAHALEARAEAAPQREAAPVARLDAHRAQRPVAANWRFAPRLDLMTGRVAGAQLLRDGFGAEFADAEALRLLLDSITPLQAGRRGPVRLSLDVRLDGDAEKSAAVALAKTLAETGVAPHWLDLRFDAAEIFVAPGLAEEEARALKNLGVGVTLNLGPVNLGVLGRDIGKTGRLAAPIEHFIDTLKPTVAFSCPASASDALRVLRLLGRGARFPLVAGDVANAALLRLLRRVGVREAQGPCFGAPFAARDLSNLFPPAETGALKLLA